MIVLGGCFFQMPAITLQKFPTPTLWRDFITNGKWLSLNDFSASIDKIYIYWYDINRCSIYGELPPLVMICHSFMVCWIQCVTLCWGFCSWVYERYQSIALFSCIGFVWFWSHGNAGYIKWIRKWSICFVGEIVYKISVISSKKCLVWYTNEIIGAWNFLAYF